MKRSEAEPMILQEWRSWASEHVAPGERRDGNTGLAFYRYLQQERSWMLDFPAKGDRWQDVHAMLLGHKEVFA